MALSINNDKYLAPPEVDEIEFELQISVSVTFVHTTSVVASSQDGAKALAEEMRKQLIEDAVNGGEHSDVDFSIEYITDPRDR